MTSQLTAQDWLELGLKVLAKNGFTALKADLLAKAMGVSRGSFYWHFADVGAFHAAILNHWREVAAEAIIRNVEAAARAAVQAIDRRRLGYVANLLERAGLAPDVAAARAQILYWAFLGYALSEQPLPKATQQMVLDELSRMVLRQGP